VIPTCLPSTLALRERYVEGLTQRDEVPVTHCIEGHRGRRGHDLLRHLTRSGSWTRREAPCLTAYGLPGWGSRLSVWPLGLAMAGRCLPCSVVAPVRCLPGSSRKVSWRASRWLAGLLRVPPA
jgi:hypothetical protein